MRLIRNVLIFGLLLVSRGLVAQELRIVPPVQLGLAPDRLDQIVTLVEEAVEQEEVAGAVTLVARLGRVGHLEAVGWRDVMQGVPMETDTLFRIASMTKAVTSVAAMKLYESGALLLTDPVSLYLPEFADMQVLIPNGEQGAGEYTVEPASGPITIRHLLTHIGDGGVLVGCVEHKLFAGLKTLGVLICDKSQTLTFFKTHFRDYHDCAYFPIRRI